MNKKSYADQCLERANAATTGPWGMRLGCHIFSDLKGYVICDVPKKFDKYRENAEFIAAAREMVPELARRLRMSLETISMLLENDECRQDQDCDHCLALQVIDDLEAMTEGK